MRTTKSAMKRRNSRIAADTDIDASATELLFEVEDVAELLAEITGEDVEVEADGAAVEFTVGEDTFTCEAEESDEVVESATRIRNKRKVSATTAMRNRKAVKAGKTMRRVRRK